MTDEHKAKLKAASAATLAREKAERSLSERRFGHYAVARFDEFNWVWWDTRKPGEPDYHYYPTFGDALRGLGRRLTDDHAVTAGKSVAAWLAGCEKIAATIEKVLKVKP
jgi:hypothetical protein